MIAEGKSKAPVVASTTLNNETDYLSGDDDVSLYDVETEEEEGIQTSQQGYREPSPEIETEAEEETAKATKASPQPGCPSRKVGREVVIFLFHLLDIMYIKDCTQRQL